MLWKKTQVKKIGEIYSIFCALSPNPTIMKFKEINIIERHTECLSKDNTKRRGNEDR